MTTKDTELALAKSAHEVLLKNEPHLVSSIQAWIEWGGCREEILRNILTMNRYQSKSMDKIIETEMDYLIAEYK